MAVETSQSNLKEQAGAATSVNGSDAAASEDEISILDLLLALAERKQLIFGVTAACMILAVIVSLLLPVRYAATVTLLPPQQSSSMGGMLASQLSSMGGMAALAGGSLGIKNPNDMFVAMMKSRTVEDGMIQRYELTKEYRTRYISDTRKAMEKHITIDGSGKDGLIRITVEDWNPIRAAELANGYVDQYRNFSGSLAITEAAQRRLFFEKQLESTKNHLADAEEAMKKTQQATGVIQPDSQTRALVESAATLRGQIAAKEVQIQGMQTYATGENAQMVQSQQELASLRSQLAQLGGSTGDATGIIVPKGQIPQAGLEYIRSIREVKYWETIFDILARQFEVAKLDEARQGALIQVVDPAVVPDKRSFPQRSLIVLAATFAGLFIGVFIALILAGLQHVRSDSETASKLTLLRRQLSLHSTK